MSALSSITILIEPPRVQVPVGAQGQWVDEDAKYHDLAKAVRRTTAADVAVRTGFLRDAPLGALIVRSSGYEAMLAEIPSSDRPSTAARTVLLGADRANVLELLERHRFAGAVEKHRWFQWRTDPENESGSGLHGRRDLASAIGAECADGNQGAPGVLRVGPFESEHYCVLSSDRYSDLPALMVGYLEAVFAAASSSAS